MTSTPARDRAIAEHIGPKRTDWLTVNGVKVRLVIEWDADGEQFVRVDADGGDLEGEMPGEYYPRPHDVPSSS
jgi:hypothetical protein